MQILFVCSGNICRSPMAEALFRHEAARRGLPGVETSSAGTWGQDHSGATGEAAAVMNHRGIDVDSHVARTLDRGMLAAADLVVVMTSVHAREITDLAPEHASKVRLLKELSEIEPESLPEQASPEERLEAVLAATRPPWRRDLDLDDPYGMPLNVYERTAAHIERHVQRLAFLLSSEPL